MTSLDRHETPELPEPLSVGDFAAYYEALYGYEPFAWQSRLAESACQEKWPNCIKLPTSSGKTAAVDIAVFALAFQAADVNRPNGILTAARRVFFVVDRRIIVNEAYQRARRAARMLRDALANDSAAGESSHPMLVQVAQWLQHVAADPGAPPLDCFELRGGIYRDDAWVRSPLQPTVLTSTVDQVGSRLLFRGYGVSDRNLPIHAALTSNDSLIILDEAHCSKPFIQTMQAISRYRGGQWASQAVETPFSFVQMTATPDLESGASSVFELTSRDYEANPTLEQRHGCSKPTELVIAAGAKGRKLVTILAKELASEAGRLAENHKARRIAVVVNRVALARETFELLNAKHRGRVTLMIGRMRPIDRQGITEHIQNRFGCDPTDQHRSVADAPPEFVVATQCLEVGADLDFDGMVSQCASLDALRQRFGRLNRLGQWQHARGTIVTAEEDIQPLDKLDDDKPFDPIYGNALARTWSWLLEIQSTAVATNSSGDALPLVDFGVKALDLRCASLGGDIVKLLAPSEDAPVLMPAHVDMLCQTSPRPTPEPDVAAYLHGPNRGWPEVRVCWRADLEQAPAPDNYQQWIDAIELCPPSSAECLSVPLHVLRRWLCGEDLRDETGDVLGEGLDETTLRPEYSESTRHVLVWRGKRGAYGDDRSFGAGRRDAGRIVANDTLVIPAECGGWNLFGHVPDAPDEPVVATGDAHQLPNALARIDVADRAYLQSRACTILRVHPKLTDETELQPLYDELLATISDPEADLNVSYWKRRAAELLAATSRQEPDTPDWPPNRSISRLERLATSKARIVRYPGGLVWITDRHLDLKQGLLPLASYGDDSDSLSLTDRVELLQHLADVEHEAARFVGSLQLPAHVCATLRAAARVHDVGKADPRFQAMLLNKPLSLAYMQQQLLAKSANGGRSGSAQLPDNFRHEMVSMCLIDQLDLGDVEVDPTLLKHQVAAHHGHARPFAPVCVDTAPPGLNLTHLGAGSVSAEERSSWCPSHQLDSGIAERFWETTRRYGWWGLAYVETLLRLADWSASARPNMATAVDSLAAVGGRPRSEYPSETDPSIVLSGLDGSNPLAFLAALGLFRTLSEACGSEALRMAWTKSQGAWRPVLSANSELELHEESLLELIAEHLRCDSKDHPALRLARLVEAEGLRVAFSQVSRNASLGKRSEADWLSCNGSDGADPSAISQLQTTRRDYHAINVTGLLNETTLEHLRRSLFQAWDYADPIAGLTMHLEPREDRRHAYQWHTPSGDPTRKSWGGMIGANRLALEAWPLFQSLPDKDRLTTVGFSGRKANDTQFSWPIWSVPLSLWVLPSVLGHRDLQTKPVGGDRLAQLGIRVVYRCNRILVGKTPNLTSPTAVLT